MSFICSKKYNLIFSNPSGTLHKVPKALQVELRFQAHVLLAACVAVKSVGSKKDPLSTVDCLMALIIHYLYEWEVCCGVYHFRKTTDYEMWHVHAAYHSQLKEK